MTVPIAVCFVQRSTTHKNAPYENEMLTETMTTYRFPVYEKVKSKKKHEKRHKNNGQNSNSNNNKHTVQHRNSKLREEE